MTGRVFVDTNVLIYAHDVDAGAKHSRAAKLLGELWASRRGALSSQVLQEFYVNITRKIPMPVPRSEAREIVEAYAAWRVVRVGVAEIVRATSIEERYQISFWDALIIAAARVAGSDRVLSEDLNPGQAIDGVLIENPF